ncbi:MAG: porin family protein [Bacteroidota bacterium]
MKNRIFVSLFFILGISGAFAQNFTGGITSGLIASTVWGDNLAGFRQAGLMVGGYVQYPINESLNFQPEIRFEALGSRDDVGIRGLRTRYISFPILLNANLKLNINDKKYGIRLDLGPSIGYLLGANDTFSGVITTSQYKRIDPKIVGGTVFKISERLHFSTRLTLSVISIVTSSGRRNHCFSRQPGLCNYYATFALRYQLK